MFLFEAEKQEFGMKPMNCPGHCLMFAHQNRSYRGACVAISPFAAVHIVAHLLACR
jgi:threonyl-tRNA synthetase